MNDYKCTNGNIILADNIEQAKQIAERTNKRKARAKELMKQGYGPAKAMELANEELK